MVEEYEQVKAATIRSEHIKDRNIDELMGLAKGFLADDIIVQKEVEYMIDWIETHFSIEDIDTYPLNTIYDRLKVVMADGKLSSKEAEDIKALLTMFTGGNPISEQVNEMSSSLPLCTPAPDIDFQGKTFCLTGAFTIGTRTQCEAIIKSLGGKASKSITKKTDYLVIGIIGSEAWIHSSYGRKIEQAVNNRDSGDGISIISEEHFIKFL